MAHPSLLMYLFADRFFPPKGWRHVGVQVPCKDDVEVRLEPLAGAMVAAAFWSLRDAGLVHLELSKRKRMLVMPTTRVAARLTADPGQRPGLEGVLVDQLREGRDDHAHALVRNWFDGDVEDPHSDVIAVETEAAIELGLIHLLEVDAGRGKIAAKVFGSTVQKTEPQCHLIAGLEAEAMAVHDRWQRFAAAEQPLHAALVDQCESALNSRVEVEDPDD